MSSTSSPLSGQVALVTGAARGIGRGIAEALAAEGARIVGFDLDDCGGSVRSVLGDVSVEADVQRLFETIERAEGRLDIAINCAGIQVIRPLLEMTGAEFDRVIGVNLRGTFLVGREAARLMLKTPERVGRIINVASELAYLGRADYSAYCASKGGILSLTRAWARELAPRILVNAIAPGPTDTAMVNLESLTAEQTRHEVEAVPLGRIARVEEIAASVVFLAGPGGSFFTGACVSPNGGAVMF